MAPLRLWLAHNSIERPSWNASTKMLISDVSTASVIFSASTILTASNLPSSSASKVSFLHASTLIPLAERSASAWSSPVALSAIGFISSADTVVNEASNNIRIKRVLRFIYFTPVSSICASLFIGLIHQFGLFFHSFIRRGFWFNLCPFFCFQ